MPISRNRKKYVVYPRDYEPSSKNGFRYKGASSLFQAKKIACKMGVGARIYTQRLSQDGAMISFWNFDQDYLEVL